MLNTVELSSREFFNNTANSISTPSVSVPVSGESLLLSKYENNEKVNFLLSFLPEKSIYRPSSASTISFSMQDRVARIEVALSQIQDSDIVKTTTQQRGWDWLIAGPRQEQQHSRSLDVDIPKVRNSGAASLQSTEQLGDKVLHQIRNEKLSRNFSLNSINNKINNHVNDFNEESITIITEGNESDTILTAGTSYAVMWAQIALAIDNIKEDYVDFYANLMQKYTEMYESYNKTVQDTAANAVFPQDDANYLWFEGGRLHALGYDRFLKWVENKYDESIDDFKVPNWEQLSSVQREKMTSTLKPAFVVNDHGTIEFDLELFKKMITSPLTPVPIEPKTKSEPTYPSGQKITTVQYQAWLASFNSVGSAFQSNMQSFAQRYSQVNSTFDNLIKVLSSTISTLGDSAKDVLKSLS